jgi:prepilin signal peptidase PulO-like enzyme (type II secretory pathway)
LPPILDWTLLIVVALYGLAFGSFLNVVGYRVPRGESIVFPNSYCPKCHARIRWHDLIPVLSWLILGGKCRNCRQPISAMYPLIELATGILFAATYAATPLNHWPQMIAWWLFWLLLMAVVATDLTSMKVPDVISLPGAVVVFAAAVITGIQGWVASLLGAVGCFLVLFAIHLVTRGNMGMGDVKLYLSIGAMLGCVGGLESLVIASFYGTVIGLTLRALGVLRRRQHIPFVPFIALGVITVAFFGKELTDWYVHGLLNLQ